MLKYKPYFYYSKFDMNKEPIDKILTFDYENALEYFANRKQLKKEIFLELYEIIEFYDKDESK
jgi:hypothetical protein